MLQIYQGSFLSDSFPQCNCGPSSGRQVSFSSSVISLIHSYIHILIHILGICWHTQNSVYFLEIRQMSQFVIEQADRFVFQCSRFILVPINKWQQTIQIALANVIFQQRFRSNRVMHTFYAFITEETLDPKCKTYSNSPACQ